MPKAGVNGLAEQIMEKEKDREESYARLTVPTHVTFNHFKEHQKIEGYYENRDVPDFMGCDRLLKLDHLYGTIQLGYNPMKNKSFLFANIKTSIYDQAASRYQKELKEYQMMRSRKGNNENVIYSARRKADTAVILYKAEPKPWTEQSIHPYLMNVNQGALRKTMPFLMRDEEMDELKESRKTKRELQTQIEEQIKDGNFEQLQELRAQEMNELREQELLQTMLIRKSQQSRLFFRKINYAFDIQKHEMFQFYKEKKEKMRADGEVTPDEPPTNPEKNRDKEGEDQ